MLDALLDVLEYNGYADYIKAIYYYIRDYKGDYLIQFPEKNFLSDDVDKPDRILWSVLVIMYGDYGTSPRFGWIMVENRETILDILKKWLDEYEEYAKINGYLTEEK